jgi:multidrug efflux pump subunit AcrA (membrane-fusion protein)
MARTRSPRPWPSVLLGMLCVGAIVAGVLLVGPASGSSGGEGRVITVALGVVQSTVSGSGNVQPASQLDLGFKTAGVVSQIYVAQGQHVSEGRLLAELDPTSAEVALEQARAGLRQAQASLVQTQEAGSEAETESSANAAARAPAQATHSAARTGASSNPAAGTGASSGSTAISPALREADIASARATLRSDELAVQSAEEALANTKLYAPQTGTIVALSGAVGETVSAGGTTKDSVESSSGGSDSSSTDSSTGGGTGRSTGASSTGGSSAAGSGAAALGGSGGGSGNNNGGSDGSSSSASTGSSGTTFAVLSDLSSMQLVVPLSESEVGDVHPGQPATVTVEALEGAKLAAHVVSVATLPSSSSGVVSYDVTFQLDQLASGLKPGMSATAEVVVKQAEGVNVPTAAISGATVTVVQGGRQIRRRVLTGLAGNSSTIVLSGLRAGETILLPVARTSGASLLGGRLGGALAGRLGGGGLGGAGFAGPTAGGGGVAFRGG